MGFAIETTAQAQGESLGRGEKQNFLENLLVTAWHPRQSLKNTEKALGIWQGGLIGSDPTKEVL